MEPNSMFHLYVELKLRFLKKKKKKKKKKLDIWVLTFNMNYLESGLIECEIYIYQKIIYGCFELCPSIKNVLVFPILTICWNVGSTNH
jgi:hypothetical protein